MTKSSNSAVEAAVTSSLSQQNHPIYRLEPTKRKRRRNKDDGTVDWFQDLSSAIQTNRWEHLRGVLSLAVSQQDTQVVIQNDEETQKQQQQRNSFWRRIANSVVGEDEEGNSSAGNSKLLRMKENLIQQDQDYGRTPLHLCLYHPDRVPTDVILYLIRLEPKAATIAEKNHAGGGYPLHTAVRNLMHLEVIAGLVEAFPGGISCLDRQQQTPLSYAVDRAKGETDLQHAPKTFWMAQRDLIDPESDNDLTTEEETVRLAHAWQEEQVDRWAIVHWLLLASATHPQTSLSVGGKRPMLVDALVCAAPPAVISLLIGASVVLLTFEKRATAFAGTTIYTCISRHYPLTILLSLCLQCPRDVRLVQDETGMGLVAAQFITGFFRKLLAVTEEWTVVMEFLLQAKHVIEQGTLPLTQDHPGFCDWWRKIEFLIAFGTGQKQQADKNFPVQFLLHAALSNSDVPPLVIRLLLALYPKSIQLPTPETLTLPGSLPLHLACVTLEYIPRHYEHQIVGSPIMPTKSSSVSLDMVVEANPQAVRKRHNSRLPLHMAIAAGKLYSSLKSLVEAAPETLFCRDPETFLYPWQQVAAAGADLEASAANAVQPDGSKYNSHSRWAYAARNKYTHNVWRGLSDRQRANAVLKQYNTVEVLERISTIYKLLRKSPSVMDSAVQDSRVQRKKKGPIGVARDETGMGAVAQHFVNFLFYKSINGNSEYRELIEDRVSLYQKAIDLAPSGDWSHLPPEFERWWNKMRFWIKYCCPKPQSFSATGLDKFLPSNNEKFTLHMAVLNPDTPPAVVELILAVSAASASIPIPNTRILPLHLAIQTSPYVPRLYEHAFYYYNQRGVIPMLVQAHPQAVNEVSDDGVLPIISAIRSGRVDWTNELEPLVGPNASVLRHRDPQTHLYPFQLMALRREYAKQDRLRFLHLACNQEGWKQKGPLDKTKVVVELQRLHQLNILTDIFELMRRDVSMIEPSSQQQQVKLPSVCSPAERPEVQEEEQDNINRIATPLAMHLSQVSSDSLDQTDDSRSLTEADTIASGFQSHGPRELLHSDAPTNTVPNRNAMGYIPATLHSPNRSARSSSRTARQLADERSSGSVENGSRKSSQSGSVTPLSPGSLSSQGSRSNDAPEKASLMQLLSQHEQEKQQAPADDVYECDASMLSNLDVMSTLSSTIHNITGHGTAHSARPGRFGNPMLDYDSYSEEESSEYTESESDASGVEFGGESIVGGTSFTTFGGDESSTALSLPITSDFSNMLEKDEESATEASHDDDNPVNFQYRRKPRWAYWEDSELVNSPVRLPSGRRTSIQGSTPTMDSEHTNASARSEGRNSTVSLKSHLSDITGSQRGESKHTYKSFATEGSVMTAKSFATSTVVEDRPNPTAAEHGEAPVSSTNNQKYLRDWTSDHQKRTDKPRRPDLSDHGPSDSARSMSVRSGDDSYQSILPFDPNAEGENAVGMIWLRENKKDEAKLNDGTTTNGGAPSAASRSLLSPADNFEESKDNLFFSEFSENEESETNSRHSKKLSPSNHSSHQEEKPDMLAAGNISSSSILEFHVPRKKVDTETSESDSVEEPARPSSASATIIEYVYDDPVEDHQGSNSVVEVVLSDSEHFDIVDDMENKDEHDRANVSKARAASQSLQAVRLHLNAPGDATTGGKETLQPLGDPKRLDAKDSGRVVGVLGDHDKEVRRNGRNDVQTALQMTESGVEIIDYAPRKEKAASTRQDSAGTNIKKQGVETQDHNDGEKVPSPRIDTLNEQSLSSSPAREIQSVGMESDEIIRESGLRLGEKDNEKARKYETERGEPSQQAGVREISTEKGGNGHISVRSHLAKTGNVSGKEANASQESPTSISDQESRMRENADGARLSQRALETIEELSIASSQMNASFDTLSTMDQSLHSPDRKDVETTAVFDRATMRWVQRKIPKSTQNEPEAMETPKSTPTTGASEASSRRLIFDKTTFRWREDVEGTQKAPLPEKTKGLANGSGRSSGVGKKKRKNSIKLRLNNKSVTLHQPRPLGSIPEQRPAKEKPPSRPVNDIVCLICQENSRQVVLKPCFHLAICGQCSAKIGEIRTCPLCHNDVTDTLHIST